MIKVLDNIGVNYFTTKLLNHLLSNLKISENVYEYVTTQNYNQFKVDIPNFNASIDSIEVYKNGFRLIENKDYTVVNNSITLLHETTADQTISFIHKRIVMK